VCGAHLSGRPGGGCATEWRRKLLALLDTRPAGQKQGGQALIGGLDVTVSRNFFGSQISSFETQLPAHCALPAVAGFAAADPFRAIFIRAPAVMSCGPGVEVLAEFEVPPGAVVAEAGVSRVAVAVRQGRLLGTAFHPEITADGRWHALFVGMCASAGAPSEPLSAADPGLLNIPPPLTLPIF